MAGYAVFAVVSAEFAVAGDAMMAGGLFLLYTLYYALTEGVGRALITDLVPASLRATALGTYATAPGAALLPASLVAGGLWDRVGPQAPFVFGAALAAVAVAPLFVTRAELAPGPGRPAL